MGILSFNRSRNQTPFSPEASGGEGLGMRAFDEARSRCDFSTALEMTNADY